MKKEIQYDTGIGLYCKKCDRKFGYLFNGTIGFKTTCRICNSSLDVYKFGTINPPVPDSKVDEFYKKEGWSPVLNQ